MPDAGKRGKDDCERCDGTGKYERRFRYADIMTPALSLFVSSFGRYRKHGTLPHAGGFEDQSATWAAAVQWLEERVAWIDKDREARQRKTKGRTDNGDVE